VLNLRNKYILLPLVLTLMLIVSPFVYAQNVQISLLNQDPDPVSAGDVVEVRFQVETYWEGTRDEVVIEVLPEYPFSVYSGSSKVHLGKLKGRQLGLESFIIDFKLKVDEDAVDGDNELKLQAILGDTIWVYDDEFYIDVEKEELRLYAYVRSSDLTIPGKQGTVSLEVANAGGQDIEFLQMDLLPSSDYKLLSTSDYIYLGNLESDDTESEDIDVYIPEGKTEVNIPIKLTYEVNDKVYKETYDIKLNLLTQEEALNIGLIKESNASQILIGVIVVLILLIIWKIYRKRKKNV
jgi:hypothetical protein